MKNIKVVIGASFGDEGKGLMTDYFSNLYEGEHCLNVLSNGGPQRGHTVNIDENKSHVFHHFGSGTLSGADTYLPRYFMVNPALYMQELKELRVMGIEPRVYVNPKCMLITPMDMVLNQLKETSRGDKRHGSCGHGIWETVKRYKEKGMCRYVEDFRHNTVPFLRDYLYGIKINYFDREIEKYRGIIKDEWCDVINSMYDIIDVYIEDFYDMMKNTCLEGNNVLEWYDNIVFENGQGLLLSQDAVEYGVNTTPSFTGLRNVREMVSGIEDNNIKVEVCYVTRSYVTRHGAGRFDTECSIEELFGPQVKYVHDETNVPNEFQGTLRYGKLNIDYLISNVDKDFYMYSDIDWVKSVCITHINEKSIDLSRFCKKFDRVYISNSKCGESVMVV